MNDKEYLKEKRIKMLEAIKPICEAFKIKEYDYLIEDNHEILKLNELKIGCGVGHIQIINEILKTVKRGKVNKMNKYQKALNKLGFEVIENKTTLSDGAWYEYVDDIEYHVSTLQLLIDRATPKKPIEDIKSPIMYVKTYECPNCHNKFTGNVSMFCYHCGQAIDWSK